MTGWSIAIQRYCYTARGRSVLLLRRQNPDENIEYWPRPTNKILSAGPCIVYGRFPALFGRPFSIALLTNRSVSSGPCNVYGNFPALFVAVRSCMAWRHRSFPPLSGPTCIIYGRFSALFRSPFCIALSTNQILSSWPCIVYGRFPALFGRPFCIALLTNRSVSSGPCNVYGNFPALFVAVRSCMAWRHRSFPPLSGPTCIIYGRFSALFRSPFCTALSTNQILSSWPCIVYGPFPAMWNPSVDRYGPVRRLRVMSMGVFRHCSVAPFVYPSRPIKSCRHLRAFPMAVFRYCSVTLH